MKIETFELERIQSVWENIVKYNLTESGVHPLQIKELLNENEIKTLLSTRLGYGQTNGSIKLREAICQMYPGSTVENVLVTSGSAEANFIGLWSTLEPGDELVYMLPNYMQLWGIARNFKINVKTFSLKEKLNWKPDIEDIKKLVNPKTKVIAVCNPNNPTGSVLSEQEMNKIIQLAEKNDAWIFADEVYRGAELNDTETPSFWGKHEKVLITCGLSKAYALPGIRIGWLIGPENKIEDCWSHHDYTTIAAPILSNQIATIALQAENRKKILERNRAILKTNLSILKDWLKVQENIFHFIPPQAGGMAFLNYNLEVNSTELSNRLRETKDVFVLPGDCYGMDKYIRIGIGGDTEHFTTGLKLLEEGLKELYFV